MTCELTDAQTIERQNGSRIERYSKIRSWLDYPYPQRPNPHQILSQMLKEEQTLNLRLTNTNRTWNLITASFDTVADTALYEISLPASVYQAAGKPHFVLRGSEEGEDPFIPVSFTEDITDPMLTIPTPESESQLIGSIGEKVAFYRTNIEAQRQQLVVYPTPSEVLTYKVWYYVGERDRAEDLMTSSGPMVELSDLMDLKSSLALLPYSRWTDDEGVNTQKRRELSAALLMQVGELDGIADKYINKTSQRVFDMSVWNDD